MIGGCFFRPCFHLGSENKKERDMWEGLQAVRKEIQESVNTIHDNEEIHDGFQLRFVGKSYAKFVTGLPSETVLVPDNDWNNQENNKDSQNIFITGDNLDALKHLVNAYSGAIKMIYIDPPYNTGSDGFVYKDSFKFSDDDLKQKLGFSDTELARLRALDGKCSHSAWLTFMLPRLILAKRLLSDDGVIFISIDDNEQANLKMICDEAFNESNFVCQFIWTNNEGGGGSDSKFFKTKHEYILSYAKNINLFSTNNVSIDDVDRYKLSDEYVATRGKYQLVKLSSASIQYSRSLDYPITMPDGTVIRPVQNTNKDKACWRWSKTKLAWGVENGFVVFKKDKNSVWQVYTKQYINCDKDGNIIERTKVPLALIDKFSSTQASNCLIDLMQAKVFAYPKPVELLKWLVDRVPDNNFTILDFFAGSATTAHAVMQLNKEDGGNRKYIMVQWDESVKPGSEAENQGFKTIDEISRKRIKLAAEQIGDTSGFKHYKLAKVTDDLILDKIDEFDPTKPNLLSDDMVSPFSGNALGTGLNASGFDTLLTTWMVDDGYPINTQVEEFKFGNYVAYSPVGSRRLYLIADGWDSNATQDLLNKIGCNEISVQTIIIYNHSFNFTMLTELKNNLKHVLDDDKKIEFIERF